MVLILIFAEVLGLYGYVNTSSPIILLTYMLNEPILSSPRGSHGTSLIVALILNSKVDNTGC